MGGRGRGGIGGGPAPACRLIAGSQLARRDRPEADAAALLELGDLPLDPVEVQVDLPLVVAAEADPEDDVVDLLRADRRADGSPARVASTRSRKASTSSTL